MHWILWMRSRSTTKYKSMVCLKNGSFQKQISETLIITPLFIKIFTANQSYSIQSYLQILVNYKLSIPAGWSIPAIHIPSGQILPELMNTLLILFIQLIHSFINEHSLSGPMCKPWQQALWFTKQIWHVNEAHKCAAATGK